VDSISDADFCLLSACRPDATEAAAHIVKEGNLAIDASWIWESVSLGRLLPWYQYQLRKPDGPEDTSDEIRDLHELTVCLARHLPIVGSTASIYTHLAMKVGQAIALVSFSNPLFT